MVGKIDPSETHNQVGSENSLDWHHARTLRALSQSRKICA